MPNRMPVNSFNRCGRSVTGFLLVWFISHVFGAAVTANAAQTKVACIGDSITAGAGVDSALTYPIKLGRLLGTNSVVRNYGVSGRTLLKRGDFPYWKEGFYQQSLAWNPDVVILMLGTNDGKPQNWKYASEFEADYEALVDSYAALASKPRILVVAPCPVFKNGAFDINPGVVNTNIAPKVRALGARLGLEVVDLQAALAGGTQWFPDTVHPDARGTTVMATLFWRALNRIAAAPAEVPPVAIEPIAGNRFRLSWPAESAGFLVQTRATLGVTNISWLVLDTAVSNNGSTIAFTNSLSGSSRYYRLLWP